MVDVIIYTKSYCPYSKTCKEFLDGKGVKYTEYVIDTDPASKAEMELKSGRTDTPQIFIGGHHIGSGDDLKALDQQGEFDKMLGL
ncbi:MAG: glutaredoxin 3 [Candidatus Gracilibacteria bacterium]|jgi:glutaredoxin 3